MFITTKLVLFIITCIDNGAIILTHLQDFFNYDIKIDLFLILKEIGWVFLWLAIAIMLEIAAVFGVISPMAKSEMNNNR